MFKLFLILVILTSDLTYGQGTTTTTIPVSPAAVDTNKDILYNVSLQARTIEALVPFILSQRNEELDDALFIWRNKFRDTNPRNLQTVSLDSISLGAIVQLYRLTVTNPHILLETGQQIISAITYHMNNNTYFKNIITGIDLEAAQLKATNRLSGRRRLMGKYEQ